MALSEFDKATIADNAYSYYHNYDYYSLFLGEPYFNNYFLYYFDGNLLSINTHFLDEMQSQNLTAKRDAIWEIIGHLKPEAINIWGPYQDGKLFYLRKGWKRYRISDRNKSSQDITLILPSFSPDRVPHLAKSLSYIKKNDIKITWNTNGQFSAGHISLLENLVSYHNPDLFDRAFYIILLPWLTISNGVMFDIYEANLLIGFGILDLSLPNLPIFLTSSLRTTSQEISDALYYTLITYCVDKGYERLSLGPYSRGENFQFKIKWGQCIIQKNLMMSLLTPPNSLIQPEKYLWILRNL